MGDDETYLLIFPVYMVLVPEYNNAPLLCVDPKDPTDTAVAIYTEELLAERARDAQAPTGIIRKIATATELETKYYPVFRKNGVNHVIVDTHERTGLGIRMPLEDE